MHTVVTARTGLLMIGPVVMCKVMPVPGIVDVVIHLSVDVLVILDSLAVTVLVIVKRCDHGDPVESYDSMCL